ncbi:MAG: N-formylglutamate amidohydrolase [Thermoanaerobaculia bacterium]|nr:N-formylglutamate amidohydrolase [Thermoanaerobaculia bacterium]
MKAPFRELAVRSSDSIDGVAEVYRGGDEGRASLLIELPHGATEREHYDALAAQLRSPLPAGLEQFFHVNTDFGVPELAGEIAARLTSAARKVPVKGVVVVRALVPRTFIDFNREIAAGPEAVAAGMTPGLPPYISAGADQQLLLSLHQQYHATVAGLYREICGAPGGLAVALHSYAPRSVEVAVDADIVTALREAYRPEAYAGWVQRPGVDFITRDADGLDLSPAGLVAELKEAYSALDLEVGENATYHLHPATMGYRYAASHPGQVLCVEFRRDLLGAPWQPFAPSPVDAPGVAQLARPLAEALARRLAAR